MSQPLKPIPQLREPPLIGSFLDFKNRRLELLLRLLKECGDVGAFHLGPVKLVALQSAEVAEAVLVKEAQKVGRGPFYKIVSAMTGEHSVFLAEGPSHRRMRQLYAPIFQLKRLITYVKPMVEYADQFQRKFQGGEQVDMEQEWMRLAQRVVEKTLFNREDEDGPGEIFKAMAVASEYFSHTLSSFILTPLSWPLPRNIRMRKARAVLVERSQMLIDEWRAQGGKDRGDFLSMLMVAQVDGVPLKHEEIIDHVVTLYNAGHETTAVALMWIFYFLSQNPEVEAKLHEELDTVLGGRKLEHSDLAQLPYTLKVVKEGLRLGSPPYVYGRAPMEDIDVAGYRLPKGQMLIINVYGMHRNPKYYPDPERFDPERFSPENEKKLPRSAWLPFGNGPMICAGMSFAMMELQCIVAHIAQHMRFKFIPEQGMVVKPGLTLRPSSMRMIAERRTPISREQRAVGT